MELTKQDIELLMDGLDAIKTSKSMGATMGMVLSSMLARTDEEREKFKREDEKRMRDQEAAIKILDQRIILLKAKLIQMSDSAFAKSITTD